MSVIVCTRLCIGLMAVLGLLSIMAALFNWDWFFTTQSARMLTMKLSRGTARIIYGLLGLAIMAMSGYMFSQTI